MRSRIAKANFLCRFLKGRRVTDKTDHRIAPVVDPAKHNFSHAFGYETLPNPLQLGELPRQARIDIWNTLISHVAFGDGLISRADVLTHPWFDIFKDVHRFTFHKFMGEFDASIDYLGREYGEKITGAAINEVFDILLALLRTSRHAI